MAAEVDRLRLDQAIASHRGSAIVTGMAELSSPAELAPFQELFGSGPEFQARYDLYFHWYNLIHELAHLARRSAGLLHVGTTPIMEERHANDFAVGYWRYRGEHARLEWLHHIVSDALEHTLKTCPEMEILEHYKDPGVFHQAGRDPREYAFIQFSMVRNALQACSRGFGEELLSQGFRAGRPREEQNQTATSTEHSMQAIVDQAIDLLRRFGLNMEDVRVLPHYNPNEHRIK